jgi:hypothetical protein
MYSPVHILHVAIHIFHITYTHAHNTNTGHKNMKPRNIRLTQPLHSGVKMSGTVSACNICNRQTLFLTGLSKIVSAHTPSAGNIGGCLEKSNQANVLKDI